jgi:hypothetical protein
VESYLIFPQGNDEKARSRMLVFADVGRAKRKLAASFAPGPLL